jgi:CBS domain-containing protein
MSRDVVACSPEDDVRRALELMSQHRKSRILCTNDDGVLVGVISLSDLAQQVGKDAAGTLRDVSSREARA